MANHVSPKKADMNTKKSEQEKEFMHNSPKKGRNERESTQRYKDI
jgi:hypothetical protein